MIFICSLRLMVRTVACRRLQYPQQLLLSARREAVRKVALVLQFWSWIALCGIGHAGPLDFRCGQADFRPQADTFRQTRLESQDKNLVRSGWPPDFISSNWTALPRFFLSFALCCCFGCGCGGGRNPVERSATGIPPPCSIYRRSSLRHR